jgi:transcriptional repressor NrdR
MMKGTYSVRHLLGSPLMKCPYCRRDQDRVIDSRSSEDGFAIRRRRECLSCRRRYTTYERLEEIDLKVVKKDLVREPFNRNKISAGLAKACWKRPISDGQILALVADLEQAIYERDEGEIDSRTIGEMVMERLAELDQVAFVRFASVYREFKDVRDFVDELQPMLDNAAKSKG